MTKIGIPTRATLIVLTVLMGVAPLAQAKRWYDEDNGQQRSEQRSDKRSDPRYDQRNDYAPREYYQPREQAPDNPGIGLDRAVSQASREGRVLSADVVDGGYRVKVLTPQGRVRVLYYGGGR